MSEWELVDDNEWELVEQPKRIGFEGIQKDIEEGLEDIYPTLVEGLKGIPSLLSDAAKFAYRRQQYGINPAPAIAQQLFAGLAKGGEGLLNLPSQTADYLAARDFISPESAQAVPRKEPRDYAALLGLENEPGAEVFQGLGTALPFLAGGEAGALTALPRMGARSLSQGLLAASQGQNPVTGAGMVLGTEGPLRGAGKAYQASRPSNIFRGTLPTQELSKRVQVVEGTNTPLGDVIQSPILKKTFENVTAEMPFAGGEKLLQKISNQVQDKADYLMRDLGGKISNSDPNEVIKNAIDKTFEQKQKVKNKLYEKASNLAEAEGLQVDMPRFSGLAKQTAQAIDEAPLLKTDPTFRKAYFKALGLQDPTIKVESPILDSTGRPMVSREIKPSIVETKILAGKLYDQAQQYRMSPLAGDRAVANLYSQLAKAARLDVADAIKNASPKVRAAYKKADKVYKKDFAPFLDKEIYRLINPKKSSETIVRDIIKPSKAYDRASFIQKVQDILPASERSTLGYAYLRGAVDEFGNINPKKLAQLTRSLGERQTKALFTPEQQKQLLDFGMLRGMNEEALNVMHNPKTGYRNAKTLLGMASAFLAGTTDVATSLGTAATAIGLSKAFNKIMTSEKVRTKLVKQMLKNEAKKLSKRKNKKNTDVAIPVLAASRTTEKAKEQQRRE